MLIARRRVLNDSLGRLETGSVDDYGTFVDVRGGGFVVVFLLTVGDGDTNAALEVISTASLEIPDDDGWSYIRRDANYVPTTDATLTLPEPGFPSSLSYTSKVVLNTETVTADDATAVTAPGEYGAGHNIDIDVTFDFPVAVTAGAGRAAVAYNKTGVEAEIYTVLPGEPEADGPRDDVTVLVHTGRAKLYDALVMAPFGGRFEFGGAKASSVAAISLAFTPGAPLRAADGDNVTIALPGFTGDAVPELRLSGPAAAAWVGEWRAPPVAALVLRVNATAAASVALRDPTRAGAAGEAPAPDDDDMAALPVIRNALDVGAGEWSAGVRVELVVDASNSIRLPAAGVAPTAAAAASLTSAARLDGGGAIAKPRPVGAVPLVGLSARLAYAVAYGAADGYGAAVAGGAAALQVIYG